nr:polysaccharide deacetylase family protein [Velocimicrobium porci]
MGFYYLPDAVATMKQTSDRKLPIYCVEKKEPKVALSFDAAWGNEDTKRILKILKKHNVHVTFFMTGGWIESYPDDVKAIAKAGHDLGNHSENHKQMSQLSKEQCKEELMKPHEKVKKLTGKDMILFRPPYGDYNNTVVEAANENGYHCIQWDVDSLDWKDYGVDSILNTVLNHKHLGNGSIILCHNGAKYTADALDDLITGLEEKGFQLVRISDLIYKDNYEMDAEGRQHKA